MKWEYDYSRFKFIRVESKSDTIIRIVFGIMLSGGMLAFIFYPIFKD